MIAYINEQSLPTYYSKEEARRAFENIKAFYEPARACGIRDIKIVSSFYQHKFTDGYDFYAWVNDDNVDKDFRTLLKSVIGTTPFADEIFKLYENSNQSALTFDCDGKQVIGLGLASNQIFNTIAFSYSNNGWDAESYRIIIKTLKEDENNKVTEDETVGETKNISNVQHVKIYTEFIVEQISRTVYSGKELWLRKKDLFPSLTFCDHVKSQLYSLGSNALELPVIISRLFDLQGVAAAMDGNPIQPEIFPTKTTPESQSRLDNDWKKLTFLCPDGKDRTFSWHSRFTPGAGRIHFYPFEKTNEILIGSIANQNSIK